MGRETHRRQTESHQGKPDDCTLTEDLLEKFRSRERHGGALTTGKKRLQEPPPWGRLFWRDGATRL